MTLPRRLHRVPPQTLKRAMKCSTRAGMSSRRWRRETSGADAGLVTLTVVADAFCHSMVRSLVGAGLAVGQGRRPASWPGDLLTARSRDGAAPVAPPHGLTLDAVSYPPDDELAAQAQRARIVRSLPGGDCGC